MKNSNTLLLTGKILLILMWTYAAFSKLFTYADFRFELLGHQLLAPYAFEVAWMVPALELGISIMLLIQRTEKIALYASALLLSCFTIYIINMFQFYPQRPCSCGGFISQLNWKEHIVFNLVFLILSLIIVSTKQLKKRSPPKTSSFLAN